MGNNSLTGPVPSFLNTTQLWKVYDDESVFTSASIFQSNADESV